jgi:hypothetical protein
MGTTGTLGTIAMKAAKSFVDDFGEWFAKGGLGYIKSSRGVLESKPIGKVMSEFLQNEFEPGVKKLGQQYLEHKINAGFPPEQAAREAVQEAWHDTRKAMFGKNDEALIKFVHSATKQHGIIYGNNVADVMSTYLRDQQSYWRRAKLPIMNKTSLADIGINANAEYRPPKEWEHSLRSTMSWMFTPFIAIPHLGQFANVILDTSFKDVAVGTSELFSKVNRQQFMNTLIRSGALFDEIRFQMIEDAAGGGIVRKLFHNPGFNWVRRHEIMVAAAAGKHAAQDAADRLVSSSGDKWAEFTLRKLGIDPAKIFNQGGQLLPEDIEKAMLREADRTIFFRSSLETPWKWEESAMSRMVFMYKHFLFRQGNFIRRSFMEAAKNGGPSEVLKTALTFGTLFPVVGEIVHSLENAAHLESPMKRDKKDALMGSEYVDAMGTAAGLGLFYTIMRASQYNGLKGWFAGPILSTAADVASIPYKLEKGNTRGAVKTVLTKMGVPGRVIARHIKPKRAKKKEE